MCLKPSKWLQLGMILTLLPGVSFSTQLEIFTDIRAVWTDSERSWLEGGFGKNRFGQNNDAALLRLAELSILMEQDITENWILFAQLKTDQEQQYPLDIVEAFFTYKPIPKSKLKYQLKLGAFFPPISLEHRGKAWTSPYTITPSAINSWVGEELRTVGIEAKVKHKYANLQTGFTAALALFNDPAGSLLSWRGWSLHDRKTGLFDQQPLPPISSIQPGGAFESQAGWVEPFHEIDKRFGGYLGADFLIRNVVEFEALIFDMNADGTQFQHGQYAWDTEFLSLGIRYFLPLRTQLLFQYMRGNTEMGQHRIDNDFLSSYWLLSKRFGHHTLSFRYDSFEVIDIDNVVWADNNNEKGEGFTAAYQFKASNHHSFQLEYLLINGHREQRVDIGLTTGFEEKLIQLNWRYTP